MKKLILVTALTTAFGTFASDMTITVEIPTVNTEGKYYRPYVAGWIENSDKQLTNHVFVWYQDALKNEDGEEWLKHLRTWWRKGGNKADMPIDGVSAATKRIGKHKVNFSADSQLMQSLTDGSYTLYIEAKREEGGSELLHIPFSLPIKETTNLSVKGKSELGEVNLQLIP